MITAFLLAIGWLGTLVLLLRKRREVEDAFNREYALKKKITLLEQSVERFSHAAEALPEGVVILDKHKRIEWINLQAETYLGLNAAKDVGSPINHLLREPAFIAYLESAATRGPLELRTQRNPGHLLQIQRAPFSQDRMLMLVRDVTQIDRMTTMRRDFVANVSHELKTPLTVTLGFLETAQDALADTPPEEIATYLQTAAEQAERMRRLIDDLLMLSSLETDIPPPLDEIVSFADLVAEVRAEALALSGGRHTLEVSTAGIPEVRGSYRELHSVLLNLASNAVRYTPEGGRLGIIWRNLHDGGGELCVSDSGIGIAQEHISRLTERFYRVDRGRSREVGGTGLGLAIVKHVLERHGGSLNISSETGKGSSFCVILPATRLVR